MMFFSTLRRAFSVAFILLGLALLPSCRAWNPNRMFITPKDYAFAELIDSIPQEIRLGAGDLITVQILTNDGYSMLTPGLVNPIGGFRNQGNTFEVDLYGKVRLPFVDTVLVEGLTIREAERKIEEEFKVYFRNPFTQLTVVNRRAFLFGAGGGMGGAIGIGGLGNGIVVPLESENPTLIEVLAQAGGIPPTNKAYAIKLIRQNDEGEYDIALINLRTLEDMNKTQIFIRHRDVIYVDPLIQTTFLNQIVGILSTITALSGIVLLYAALTR